MTGEQLEEKMSGDWDRAANKITQLEKEIQRLLKQVCDQDEALVESAYAISDAFRVAFNSRGNE